MGIRKHSLAPFNYALGNIISQQGNTIAKVDFEFNIEGNKVLFINAPDLLDMTEKYLDLMVSLQRQNTVDFQLAKAIYQQAALTEYQITPINLKPKTISELLKRKASIENEMKKGMEELEVQFFCNELDAIDFFLQAKETPHKDNHGNQIYDGDKVQTYIYNEFRTHTVYRSSLNPNEFLADGYKLDTIYFVGAGINFKVIRDE